MEEQYKEFYCEIIKLLDNIENKVTSLSYKVEEQEKVIISLEKEKRIIDKKHEILHSKVKEYLQELDEIRKYVNHNNQSSK